MYVRAFICFLCCPLIESHMLIMCCKAPPTHGRHHCRAPLHDVHQVAAIRKASRIKRCIRPIQIRPSDFWRELETRLKDGWSEMLCENDELLRYGRPTTKLEALVASDCSQYTSANWSVCCTKISFLRQIWLMKSPQVAADFLETKIQRYKLKTWNDWEAGQMVKSGLPHILRNQPLWPYGKQLAWNTPK